MKNMFLQIPEYNILVIQDLDGIKGDKVIGLSLSSIILVGITKKEFKAHELWNVLIPMLVSGAEVSYVEDGHNVSIEIK